MKTNLKGLRTELTENEQVKQHWNNIKHAVIEAATETIGEEKRTKVNGMMRTAERP
jgi:hypothetical protein